MTDDMHPYGTTSNGYPVPGGFTGTIPAFLGWIEQHLVYGGVTIGEPEPARYGNRQMRRVKLVTGGWSDDEGLLHRVDRSLFSLAFWASTHRGGLYVHEIPVEQFDSAEETTWLEPPSDVFERVHRARTVVIVTPGGEHTFAVPAGARLRYNEPDRDINEPAGVITVEAIDPETEPT